MSGRCFAVGGVMRAMVAVAWLAAVCLAQTVFAGPVDFQRQIRPLLSDICFECHGPDGNARQADLRFDVREGLFKDLGGYAAIVPGAPEQSELIRRLTSDDPDDRMPPPDHPRKLTDPQIELIRQWIAEGAPWGGHWSFTAPTAPPIPPAPKPHGARNPIDHFVLARLEREGLKPSMPADKTTLLRRVSLDLTGLPPAPAEVEAFLHDTSPGAYDRLIARLLDSPRYGERMAVDWLDAARYSDTNGYFRDTARQIWPWRDWVIDAFNRNLPYDQFTIEQIAGDLLPEPTQAQKVATGFNRNHMVTGETGIIDEEYRVEYVADRLETTATVWMGLTVGCARCHDHKYDPLTQREYYRLFAFFNNGPGSGLVSPDDPPPTLDVATPEQRATLERLKSARLEAGEKLDRQVKPLRAPMAAWEKNALRELAPPGEGLAVHFGFEPGLRTLPGENSSAVEKGAGISHEAGVLGQAVLFDAMQHLELPAELPIGASSPWSIGIWIRPTGSLNCILAKIEPTGARRGFEIVWQKGQLQINLVNEWVASAIEVTTREALPRSGWHHAIVSYDGSGKASGMRVFVDGKPAPLQVVRNNLNGPTTNAEPLRLGRRDNGLGFYGHLDEFRMLKRPVDATEARAWFWSDRLRDIIATADDQRDKQQKDLLLDYYIERHGSPEVRLARHKASAARETENAFRADLPKTLVMQEREEPRPTHLLMRGQYDEPGEAVLAGPPASLPPLPDGAPRNRLGFARWLVSPSNPLTARVQVNRLWQQCFGEGLVRTVDDFGSQGELPTHPELLDWLALRFMESGWDVKEMLRFIVSSATYRQASSATPELLERDPDNRLLARGPRFRLPAEMIRDQALAASGLLIGTIGGPGVKPYQPPGLWEAVSYDGELSYQADQGAGLWRRSLYTFWKRQAPPPAMLAFDGPTREKCTMSRPRTNTPLQALVLLNDETYVEAARSLTARVLAESGNDNQRLERAFRLVTVRPPEPAESQILLDLLRKQRTRFANAPNSAESLTRVGESARGRELDPAELAAWTVVTHALLNLDETITRR